MKTEAVALTIAGAAIVLGVYLEKKSKMKSVVTNSGLTYYPKLDMLGDLSLSRGYRNNNPVNIRFTSESWKGKIKPNTDGEFEQFKDLVYGYRAAIVLLRGKGYMTNPDGALNTIEKIITKFAPKSENNTAGYIKRVSQMSGIAPDTIISRNDKESISKILYAMSIVENDSDKYKAANHAAGLPSMDIINEAWKLI